MSQTDILTTANDFLLQTGDPLNLEDTLPEMLESLAKMCPVFGQVMVLYNTVPQAFYDLPPALLQLLSLHFFPRELEPAGVRWAQDTLDPAWRLQSGLPARYTQELEPPLRVRLIPTPTMTGPAGVPPFVGIPGAMVPTNHLVALYLETPQVVDLAPWGEDLVAYLLVAWESIREGVQQDVPMVQTMATLVGMLVALLKDLMHTPGEELVETAWEMPYWINWPQQ